MIYFSPLPPLNMHVVPFILPFTSLHIRLDVVKEKNQRYWLKHREGIFIQDHWHRGRTYSSGILQEGDWGQPWTNIMEVGFLSKEQEENQSLGGNIWAQAGL